MASPPGDGVPTRPFVGGVVDHRWGPINIVYAMRVGTVPGKAYVAAGLRVRYLYQGQMYSTVAWTAIGGCVVSNPDTQTRTPPWCDKAFNSATAEAEKEAGVS
jgi:hypothetical protein